MNIDTETIKDGQESIGNCSIGNQEQNNPTLITAGNFRRGGVMDRSKKTVKKHLSRLVKAWEEANDLSWSTVGAPGPVFTNTTPGPDKDQAWAEHHEAMEFRRQVAADMCREALAATPSWLRGNQALVERAFRKSFIDSEGCAAWGPGIPSLPSMMSAAE